MAELLLRWEKFGLSRGLHDMLGAGELVDVTLACQGEILQAHKTVLAACSPHFKHIFVVNPSQHPVVIMQDVRLPHLKALLNFMYTGEATVAQQELPRFLKTAEALKISGLAATDDQQDSDESELSETVSASESREPPANKPPRPSQPTSSSQQPPHKRPRRSISDTNWNAPPPPPPSFSPEVVPVPAPELPAVKLEFEEGLQGEETWTSLNPSNSETPQTDPFLYVPMPGVQPSTSGTSTSSVNESHFVMESQSGPVFVPDSDQGHHWKNTPASELPGIGTVHGPKTHVAKGYFVDSYEYEKIQYSESPSSYARQLSVILFGEMVLRSSTVCGKVCPRFKKEKARPELCFKKMEAIRDNFKHWLTSRGTNEKDIAVELGLMNKYIGSKICDLRRPPRVSSSKRTKSNPKSKKSGNFEEFGSDSQPLPASTDKFGEDENSQGSQDSQADDDDNLASLSSIENLETNNSFGEFDEESQMNLIHQVIEKK